MLNIVLITGAARSGTSMTAGVIDLCGGWGGQVIGHESKPSGAAQFENTHIRNALVKPYLKENGYDPMGQNPLPSIRSFQRFEKDGPAWRSMVVEIFSEQGYIFSSMKLIYYKGAKMCLMWPLWRSAFPEAKWIIVRRSTEDIIKSCLKTPFMKAFNTADRWEGWVAVHEQRFDEMKRAGLDVKEVWPQKMIDENFLEMQEIVEWLGLKWNQEKVSDYINPKIWRRN